MLVSVMNDGEDGVVGKPDRFDRVVKHWNQSLLNTAARNLHSERIVYILKKT